MNLSEWKTAAHDDLRRLAGSLRRMAPGTLYGALASASVLPVVIAASQNNMEAGIMLGSVVGGIGANLLANWVQTWRDRNQEEIAADFTRLAQEKPEWLTGLDKVLSTLDVIPTLQNELPTADRAWFVATLQAELQRLGSSVRYEASAQGSDIAIAQGPNAQAASGGSVVARDIHGNVIINPPPSPDPARPDPDAPRRQYLTELRQWCQNLPLAALGSDEGTENAVTLDQVYIALDTNTHVPLTAEEKAQRQQESTFPRQDDSRPLSALEAASQHERLVLLGAPGAGKSTFVRMLAAWQAAGQTGEAKQSPPAISPDLLPVFVVLRQLSPRLAALELDGLPNEQQKGMLVNAVEKHLCDDLATLGAGTFAHTLRHTLHSGRCLLIFDGLDEVPHDARMRMRQAVGALLQRWRPARVLVTCRIRSYVGEAELPDFQVHTLAPLDEPRIRQFAAAWYDAQVTLRRLEAGQARRKADDLAAAAVSAELIELAENPMMLTAMAIIHQKEIGLPRQGVCLYKEVVEVLLRRWQKEKVGEKELTPSPALRAILLDNWRLLPIVQRLAYEAHQAQRQGQGAADLPRRLALELLEQDQYLGSSARAEEFLDYVDQRAGLLVGQGGDLRHPTTYSFPHRTFQEYLAGCYLIGQRDVARTLRARAADGDDWGLAVRFGVQDLLYNRMGANQVLDLAYQLCPASPPATLPARRAVLWAAVMIDRVGREAVLRDTDTPGGGEAFLTRLVPALRDLLRSDLVPSERAEAGAVLARLGDPQVEVLTGAAMEFCYVPAGPFWMGSQDDPDAGKDEQPQDKLDIPYGYW
ncbi:MAG: NACHT domain-containing protein, partial [Anaerolineae bacterium]